MAMQSIYTSPKIVSGSQSIWFDVLGPDGQSSCIQQVISSGPQPGTARITVPSPFLFWTLPALPRIREKRNFGQIVVEWDMARNGTLYALIWETGACRAGGARNKRILLFEERFAELIQSWQL